MQQVIFRGKNENSEWFDFAIIRVEAQYRIVNMIGDESENIIDPDSQAFVPFNSMVSLMLEVMLAHDLVAQLSPSNDESEVWKALRELIPKTIGGYEIGDPRVYMTSMGSTPLTPQVDAWEYRAGAFDEEGGQRFDSIRRKLEELETGEESIAFGNGKSLSYSKAENGYFLDKRDLSIFELIHLALIFITDLKTEEKCPDQGCPFLFCALERCYGREMPEAVFTPQNFDETVISLDSLDEQSSDLDPNLPSALIIAAGNEAQATIEEKQIGFPAAREKLEKFLAQ